MKKRITYLPMLLLLVVLTAMMAMPVSAAVKLNKKKYTTTIGSSSQKITLTANVKASWASNDTKVAKVKGSGKKCTVTLKKAGTVRITATADGKSATCKITVKSSKAQTQDLSSYYSSKMVPSMDDIGKNMTGQFSSQKDMKNSFNKAKTGIQKLETAVFECTQLANDSTLIKYIDTMKYYILAGQKRAKTVADNDTTIESYKKNIAKNLKKFKSRVESKY